MIEITLPDGARRSFDGPVTGLALAEAIGPRLAKDALAILCDGKLYDLTHEITQNARVEIVTRSHEAALELLRHDAAHVLAQAVQELYPGTGLAFGPAIENGFYYDFVRDEPFSSDELAKIEERMHEIVTRDEPILRELWARNDAISRFKDMGEPLKAEFIATLPAGEELSVYRQGPWLDLCRGPHLPSTRYLGHAFKLMKVSGAYWLGDAKNKQLQRITGTAWRDEKELKAYLTMLEEAEKRDHRKLGREMDLFHFQEEAPGAVFWHPRGWTLFRLLIDYMRRKQDDAGYVEISTPTVMDENLWHTSGHMSFFREHIYTTETEDKRHFALKPMNCPGGVQVFKQGITSYRDLPQRLAEFGRVHRYEHSGALHGLLRVREFTQDDAHVYCTEEQLHEENCRAVELIMSIYKDFGFDDVRIKIATRPENRIGDDAVWDLLEGSLEKALDSLGYSYTLNPGEGAFYGPKLEFVLRDAIGRDWQCGTWQVDMNLPERFDISYVGADGEKHRPVMLHRAVFGSLERFTGIMLENYAGHLPLWLAPVQVVIATITDDVNAYAHKAAARLRAQGLRVLLDLSNHKIPYKIREHSLAKVPVIAVIGRREAEEGTLVLRRLGSEQQESLSLEAAERTLARDALAPDLKAVLAEAV